MSTAHIPVSGNQRATISGMIARPQWLDEQLYPLQSRFVEIEGNRIHLKKSYRREMGVCTQPSTPDRDTSPLHHGAGWRGAVKRETRKAVERGNEKSQGFSRVVFASVLPRTSRTAGTSCGI